MTTATPTRRRRRLRPVEVADVQRLSDRLTSVTFTGQFDGFEIATPTQHIKILIPFPGEHEVALPPSTPEGPLWPTDGPRPPLRTYTPRRFDPETGRLEVQFVIHGEGPASAWAERATPGDRLAIGGPGGRLPLAIDAGPWLIAGDESALPAIGTLLDALPDDATATVHLEAEDSAQRVEIGGPGAAQIHWLDRSASQNPGSELHRALTTAPVTRETNVWVAGEAGAVRGIRRALLDAGRIDPARFVTRGYWRAGESNHPDHDHGDDA